VTKFFGLFTRRERWGLSWRGWLILALLGSTSAILLLLNVQPFLAETDPVNTHTLVVEGWIGDRAISAAVKEFQSGSYERVFTTGGPVHSVGHYINDYYTSASVGAERLKKDGVPNESLQMVPSRVMDRDRTYGSAIALRNWLRQHNMPLHSVNVVTEDVHARRTRLLFGRALGDDVTVGIIAVPNSNYDPKRWWRYSEGVKEVFTEAFAYLYAKFFFYPPESSVDEEATRTSQAAR
jgi:uncharacterized SAM-binding protein YcdF (DUF218 family)